MADCLKELPLENLTRASARTDLKLGNLCDGDSRPQADALPDGNADLGVAEDQHLES